LEGIVLAEAEVLPEPVMLAPAREPASLPGDEPDPIDGDWDVMEDEAPALPRFGKARLPDFGSLRQAAAKAETLEQLIQEGGRPAR